jgi:dihydroneopterin aldolase
MNEQAAHPKTLRADAIRGTRHVFVRELLVEATVGVHDHEKLGPQPLVISVDLTVREDPGDHRDQLGRVVCYESIVRLIQGICRNGHLNLIETLAEHIAEGCLEDQRIQAARVRVEKPEALSECRSVGIEIERLQAIT